MYKYYDPDGIEISEEEYDNLSENEQAECEIEEVLDEEEHSEIPE